MLVALGSRRCIVDRPARSLTWPGVITRTSSGSSETFNDKRIGNGFLPRQQHGIRRARQRLHEPGITAVGQRLCEFQPEVLRSSCRGRVVGVAAIRREGNARSHHLRHLLRRGDDWKSRVDGLVDPSATFETHADLVRDSHLVGESIRAHSWWQGIDEHHPGERAIGFLCSLDIDTVHQFDCAYVGRLAHRSRHSNQRDGPLHHQCRRSGAPPGPIPVNDNLNGIDPVPGNSAGSVNSRLGIGRGMMGQPRTAKRDALAGPAHQHRAVRDKVQGKGKPAE